MYALPYSTPEEPAKEFQCGVTQRASHEEQELTGSSASHTEDLPHKERKERYMLRDVLVEDLEIGCLETTSDRLEEMCISHSILSRKCSITKTDSCQGNPSENFDVEHHQVTSASSESIQTQEQNIKPMKILSCMECEVSNIDQLSPEHKLKAFFNMSL